MPRPGSIRLPTSGPILSDLYTRASSIRRLSDARRFILKSYGPLPHTPLHLRPTMMVLTILAMMLLSLLGFHPTLASHISPPVPFSDKLLHFVGLGIASGLFYGIFKVEEEARRVVVWRWFAEGMSGVVCLGGWSIGSEFVQALLPYKTFQWGDVLANLLGSSLGIYVARSLTLAQRQRAQLRQLYRPVRLPPVSARPSDPLSAVPELESDEDSEDEMDRRDLESGRRRSEVWDDGEDGIFGLGEDEEEGVSGGGGGGRK